MREACNDRGLNCQLPETQVQQMLANWETEADYEERQRHGVRVSFCQVSFGRGWQLRLSLAINLLMCRKQLGYSVRFVVVLYQVDGNDLSTQAKTAIRKDYFETIQWLKHNCNHELASGSLVVYVASAPVFHSSKMKNLAHKCALLTPWQQGCTIPTPEAGEGWNLSEQCRKAMPLDPKSFAAQYDMPGHRRALIQQLAPAIPEITCWSISTQTTSFLMIVGTISSHPCLRGELQRRFSYVGLACGKCLGLRVHWKTGSHGRELHEDGRL